jgi:hypothetical protein
MVYDRTMKYDSLRKLGRNEKLKEFARKNRKLSWAEIGKEFNISAARAWRIYHTEPKESVRR